MKAGENRIKSERYRQFLDGQGFTPIEPAEFETFLANVKHKQLAEARALVILLYYSGRRPGEIVQLTQQGFAQEKGRLFKLMVPTIKGGQFQTIFLPRNPHTIEVFNWIKKTFVPGRNDELFPSFHSKTITWGKAAKREPSDNPRKKGKIIRDEKGNPVMEPRAFERQTFLHYWFKKWSGGLPSEKSITAYFFRHSRLTQLANQGMSLHELKEFKGAKDIQSVEPYLHVSGEQMKKWGKKIK